MRQKNGYKYYLEGLNDIKRNTLGKWLLNSFSVGNLLQEARNMQDRISVEEVPSSHLFLQEILRAMRGNFQLEISYRKFYESTDYKVIIQPYLLKLFKQRWYVLALKSKDNALRIYALDRIKALQILPETFMIDNDFCPTTHFNAYFGIITDPDIPPTKIVLKVQSVKSQYFKTLPLHHSQKEIKTEGDSTFFEYFLSPTYDFRQEILSHGTEIEVISPESFQNEIKETVLKMSELYK